MADKTIYIPVAIFEFIQKLQADGITLAEAERAFAKEWLEIALEKHKYNQCRVASAEHIHRNTLARRLDYLGVTKQKPIEGSRMRHG